MSKKTPVGGNAIGYGQSLGVLFVALKLTGHIDWNWGWVVSPIIIEVLIIFIAAFIAARNER